MWCEPAVDARCVSRLGVSEDCSNSFTSMADPNCTPTVCEIHSALALALVTALLKASCLQVHILIVIKHAKAQNFERILVFNHTFY